MIDKQKTFNTIVKKLKKHKKNIFSLERREKDVYDFVFGVIFADFLSEEPIYVGFHLNTPASAIAEFSLVLKDFKDNIHYSTLPIFVDDEKLYAGEAFMFHNADAFLAYGNELIQQGRAMIEIDSGNVTVN